MPSRICKTTSPFPFPLRCSCFLYTWSINLLRVTPSSRDAPQSSPPPSLAWPKPCSKQNTMKHTETTNSDMYTVYSLYFSNVHLLPPFHQIPMFVTCCYILLINATETHSIPSKETLFPGKIVPHHAKRGVSTVGTKLQDLYIDGIPTRYSTPDISQIESKFKMEGLYERLWFFFFREMCWSSIISINVCTYIHVQVYG